MRKRWLLLGLLLALLAWLIWLAWPRPRPRLGVPNRVPVKEADAAVARKQAQSRAAGAWDVAVERLVRHHPGRAPEAILYLHGFGATRAEGEAVMDAVAARRRANLYYVRLPGHGTTAEDHASTDAADYRQAAADALSLTEALGERVIVVGTSTGGLLATWLAATWPDRVDALVLASPLFDFAQPWISPLLHSRGGPTVARWLLGEERDAGWEDARKVEGYDERWLITQRFDALVKLEELRRSIAQEELYARVRAPVLLLYYYAHAQRQDATVSVPSMRAAFARMGEHPASREVSIADGNHILMSAWVRTDKAAVRAAVEAFLFDALGPAAAGTAPAD